MQNDCFSRIATYGCSVSANETENMVGTLNMAGTDFASENLLFDVVGIVSQCLMYQRK